MANDIKWIKVITDIFEDEKIRLIKSMPEGRTLVLIWMQLLVQAGKTNAGGWIYLSEGCPYTPAMLTTLFNESQQMIEVALKVFSTRPFEMIEITDDGLIYIPNWEKHQNVESMEKIREKERLRKARQRERQKAVMSRDSHGTSQQSHATEKEEEKEIDKDKEKERAYSPPQTHLINPHQTRLHKLFNECRMEGGIYALDTVYSYIGQVDLEVIERAMKKSEGKHVNYFIRIINDWMTEGKTKLEHFLIVPDKPKKEDPELESRRIEIARSRWINEGKNPDEFRYNASTGA